MQRSYALVRSARKTLVIQVRQDGAVIVRAPLRLPLHEIEYFVESRQAWIAGHLAEIAQRPALQTWAEGRRWWHLGDSYPVLAQAQRRRALVVLEDGVMRVETTLMQDPKRLQAALWQWQKTQAASIFPERVQALVTHHGAQWQPSGLALRRMRSRWGSCSKTGLITLSTHLVHAPVNCIDYVICHEMAHMREFNHSPRFYAWQTLLCPQWQARKAELTTLAREFSVY